MALRCSVSREGSLGAGGSYWKLALYLYRNLALLLACVLLFLGETLVSDIIGQTTNSYFFFFSGFFLGAAFFFPTFFFISSPE